MLQTIPLGACLRVYSDLVIQPNEALFRHVFDSMFQRYTSHRRAIQVVHGPVQLHMFTVFDFSRGIEHHRRCQKVER